MLFRHKEKRSSTLKRFLYIIGKILLPLLLSAFIMWWMYRGVAWTEVRQALSVRMRWDWMLLSMPFGVLAQVWRAMRWRQSLEVIAERPRLNTSVNAVFLSYASSLAVPRVGEFLRCAVLKRWDGVRFTGSVGTVLSERVVDMLIVLLLMFFTVFAQIPVFVDFMARTGMSLSGMLRGFSLMGYFVTGVCACFALLMLWLLLHRLNFLQRANGVLQQLLAGVMGIRRVRRKGLFVFYSVGIWVAYFFHFYLTFYCFSFSQDLGVAAAMVAFVVGTFAVLVPTPNGAGSWHFAVKTVMVLYGVGGCDASLFVLIVHTLQTLLVALLGMYAVIALSLTQKRDFR